MTTFYNGKLSAPVAITAVGGKAYIAGGQSNTFVKLGPTGIELEVDAGAEAKAIANASSQIVSRALGDYGWAQSPTTGYWYKLSSITGWAASRAIVLPMGGDLATIPDLTENAFVLSFALSKGETVGVFVGLYDPSVTGTFVWASGDADSYRNWAPNQPGTVGTFAVMLMLDDLIPAGQVAGEWDDQSDNSNTKLGVMQIQDDSLLTGANWDVIESEAGGPVFLADGDLYAVVGSTLAFYDADIDVVTATVPTESNWVQPVAVGKATGAVSRDLAAYGYQQSPHTAYWYKTTRLPGATGTWPVARDYAVTLGGNLATLDTATENQWAFTNLVEPLPFSAAWIGLSNVLQGSGGTDFQWADATPFVFEAWDTFEPTGGTSGLGASLLTSSPVWHDQFAVADLTLLMQIKDDSTLTDANWHNIEQEAGGPAYVETGGRIYVNGYGTQVEARTPKTLTLQTTYNCPFQVGFTLESPTGIWLFELDGNNLAHLTIDFKSPGKYRLTEERVRYSAANGVMSGYLLSNQLNLVCEGGERVVRYNVQDLEDITLVSTVAYDEPIFIYHDGTDEVLKLSSDTPRGSILAATTEGVAYTAQVGGFIEVI